LTSFETLGLSQYLLNTLAVNGFETPTPIQAQAIPHLLEGRDLIGLAQTGTGKTLGFGLPIIARMIREGTKAEPKSIRALILAPTRELVNQIAASLHVFTRKSPLKITTVVGGASANKQAQMLEKGIDILVATPGRLIDLCERKALTLTATRYLVLDEADQMLDLGFIHDLKKIVKMVPKRRQTMLFSATMPQAIADLAANYLDNPVEVSVTPPGKAADKIAQKVHFVLGRDHKTALLKQELTTNADGLSLVFCKTKHGAEKLMKHLDHSGFSVASIHGNKSQGQRDRALKGFRDGDIRILVATDVAARGIDVPGVSHVYNYDLPTVPESYVHRIGRTARAGRDGVAIAFCGPEDVKLLYDIEKLMGIAIPVASGERPEWQGKKKGGGQGHRGRRDSSRAPREEASAERETERQAEPVARTRKERGENRRQRPVREPRQHSPFSEVEELSGGEFRPVRADRTDRPEFRNTGDRRERPAQQGDRPARAEHPGRGERRDHGQVVKAAHRNAPGQNRHAPPARHAGYADERNIATEPAREAAPAARTQEGRKPRPHNASAKNQWHGGNRNANGQKRQNNRRG
jgi:ATP-dependent RNA helicase RhlE